MKTFKFWVKTALVLASALGVIGIISVIVFQVLYGWHTDILSPIEHLVKLLLLGGFKIAWVCVGLAIAKLLMLVYTGEVLTKEPSKPSSKPHGIALYLVGYTLRLLYSKGYRLTDDEYTDIALYAQSVLESKNIPIPEKDEDLWKLIEPKVKQYTKPTTPEECVKPAEYPIPATMAEESLLSHVTEKDLDFIYSIVSDKGYPDCPKNLVMELMGKYIFREGVLPITADISDDVWEVIDHMCSSRMACIRALTDIMKTYPNKPEESFDPMCVGNPTKGMGQQFSDDLGKEPWVGGVETPAYKSVRDRLTEVVKTPIQDASYDNTDCPNGYPKFSVRNRLGSMLRNHGFMEEYDLGALYDYLLLRLNVPSLARSSNAEIWDAIQSAVSAGEFKIKKP